MISIKQCRILIFSKAWCVYIQSVAVLQSIAVTYQLDVLYLSFQVWGTKIMRCPERFIAGAMTPCSQEVKDARTSWYWVNSGPLSS